MAHRIGDTGDLDQSIDIRRRDEVGVLAENFHKMIVHLVFARSRNFLDHLLRAGREALVVVEDFSD